MAQLLNMNTDDNLDQVVKFTIESNLYTFRLRYNDRSGWQLSIYDPDLFNIDQYDNTEAKLYGERKLMPNQNFLQFTHGVDTLPKGYLFLIDNEFPDKVDYEIPDRYNLGQGKRFELIYFTKDEFESYSEEV